MPRKACKTGTSGIHKTGQKSTSIIKRWMLIILWRLCERYKPCKMVKKDALLVHLQGRLFLLFYRATALQRGKSFPSCAWRMPLLHRDFSLAFTLDFLGLYHSRYGFWQVHFRHLILHMRLALYLCNTASRILYFNPISCWNSAISLLSSSFFNYRNFYQTYRTLCLISSDCSFTWISKRRITCDTCNARIRNNCCLLCHVS